MRRHPALWGDPSAAVSDEEVEASAALLAARFPDADLAPEPAVDWRSVELPEPRLTAPDALAHLCSSQPFDRLLHAKGRSYLDLVAARRGDYGTPPDAVATPATPQEVAAVLDWCGDAGATCIPFGGGTSVVGGVNPPDRPPVVTLQLRRMNALLDVDHASRAAWIQGGATGPVVENLLRPHGLTLRFYPQSFEYSTVGGWLATRAAGHYATGPTHIDDLVESVSAITPAGPWTSRRLPASGAGPSPDRLLLGSEGTLGVITDAWLRVQQRPVHRAGASVRFATFSAGASAIRAITQSGLQPAGCRLLDPLEAALAGAGDGTSAVAVLSFESALWPVDADLAAALSLCRDAGGEPGEQRADSDPATQRWRNSFLRAPYLRDAMIGLGVLAETFETATTWDHFDDLVADVVATTTAAVTSACGDGIVTCRITHAYPDGAAPYFTVIAPAPRGAEASAWQAVKDAASEALLDSGATITHHHAVGRDHRPWYDRQRPDVFGDALVQVKRTLDPAGMLNPGVLIDPASAPGHLGRG